MKITAIEIRQHTFERALRGYKPEDVDAFLVSLSQEWERVTGEYKMLKMQLELAEKELGKLKEVEMTLFRTLKTAEDTSNQITDQANKAAEQYLSEARQKSDDMLADARKRSALMVQDAENQARYLKDNILNDLRALENDFKALEGYKENLATQIRALAGNAVDSVDRFEKKFVKQNLKGKIDEVANQITDELNQQDNQKRAGEDNGANAAATNEPSNSAADLPPLFERETAVPEAIPVDEPMLAKIDDAIDHTTKSANSAELSGTAETSQTTEPAIAEANSSEQTDDEAKPVEVAEETQPRKGGSFFDQI
ncbi:DivIVA domain-containing protein [Spirosoma taeanense]|uniref:DivIVA domain-containing protein n=1 Tax=Spirosoma taeanense TaxID=2735870 RepID=A0A6M5Y3M2_9BACT|nr:DivIVA domain-containing protein [Spirosoma taeanense]QJW88345.1 DivIVA domain-containing protein [Spirosoma taeanense]